MANKATLFDLYKTGKEFTIEDEEHGISVTVYLHKMNSIHQQKAQRKANAARANVLAMQRDENSEQRAEYETGFVDQFSTRDDRIQFMIADKMAGQRPKAEAEIAAMDKWSDEDYLQGLQESWQDEMQDLWVSESTRTEESERVYNALKSYLDDVNKHLEPQVKRYETEFEKLSDDELHREVVNRQLRAESDMAWLNEYRMHEIFYTVRDHKETSKFYFGSRNELDELPNLVIQQLTAGITNLSVDVSEGKESQESQDS